MSFCLVFSPPPGGDVGSFPRSVHVPIYTDTHGFQIGVCLWGGGERVCSRSLLPAGLGWGVPPSPHSPTAGKTNNPSLGSVPIWRKFERGPGRRRIPSPDPSPRSGMVGEVADRFPGQHRGRLGWSSGRWGSPPRPTPLGLPPSPSLHPWVLRVSHSLLSCLCLLNPGCPGWPLLHPSIL